MRAELGLQAFVLEREPRGVLVLGDRAFVAHAVGSRVSVVKVAGDDHAVRSIDLKRGGREANQGIALANLAVRCSDAGRPEMALAYAERGLAIQEKHLGHAHATVLSNLSNMVNYEKERGRPDLALARAEQVAPTWLHSEPASHSISAVS